MLIDVRLRVCQQLLQNHPDGLMTALFVYDGADAQVAQLPEPRVPLRLRAADDGIAVFARLVDLLQQIHGAILLQTAAQKEHHPLPEASGQVPHQRTARAIVTVILLLGEYNLAVFNVGAGDGAVELHQASNAVRPEVATEQLRVAGMEYIGKRMAALPVHGFQGFIEVRGQHQIGKQVRQQGNGLPGQLVALGFQLLRRKEIDKIESKVTGAKRFFQLARRFQQFLVLNQLHNGILGCGIGYVFGKRLQCVGPGAVGEGGQPRSDKRNQI